MTATFREIKRSGLSKRYWQWRWEHAKCAFCKEPAQLMCHGPFLGRRRWACLAHSVDLLNMLYLGVSEDLDVS